MVPAWTNSAGARVLGPYPAGLSWHIVGAGTPPQRGNPAWVVIAARILAAVVALGVGYGFGHARRHPESAELFVAHAAEGTRTRS